jgi:hypothetical protein
VDDLEAIRGIGPKKLEKMRKYLTVGKPAQNKKSSAQVAVAPKLRQRKTLPPSQRLLPKCLRHLPAERKSRRIFLRGTLGPKAGATNIDA